MSIDERTAEQVTGRQTVRKLGFKTTHLVDVGVPVRAVDLGATYWSPGVIPAICGVSIYHGVIMREGTPVDCRTCKVLNAKGL